MTIAFIEKAKLPTVWGDFEIHGFEDPDSGQEHIALTMGDLTSPSDQAPLLRIHSECLTGDALFSQRCDCGPQLKKAMQSIAAEGRGVILYLRQEGRGIGLVNKIRAYHLQDLGADTVEANHQLGFEADLREYDFCSDMLKQLGVTAVRLLTNNPKKLKALEGLGVTIEARVPLITELTPHNSDYFAVKQDKLGHLGQ